MKCRLYGKTGCEVSILGFGVMRLPASGEADEKIDYDKSTAILRKALDLGVNFLDTHHMYHGGYSEVAVGKAVKGLPRSDYFVQTKNPTWKELEKRETHRKRLEIALDKMGIDYVDFYLMHSLSWDLFERTGKRFLREARKAQREGLVKHVGFSCHASYEDIVRLVDTGDFECMLVQYNLVDISNAAAIDYAFSRGLGVSIMGPVGGGRLVSPVEAAQPIQKGKMSTPEAALRFVFSNPHVAVALSGMNTIKMVKENVATANSNTTLTPDQQQQILRLIEERKALADVYCSGCKYCMPCPQGVDIPSCFQFFIMAKVYGFLDHSKGAYERWVLPGGHGADKCIECGLCETKCPQKIAIVKQLKQAHRLLTGKTLRRRRAADKPDKTAK